MPPIPPGGIAGPASFSSGLSATIASVVINKPAIEAACMILRIDDIIATAKSAGPPPGSEGGMPPGMGGMGGMGGMPPGMGGMM